MEKDAEKLIEALKYWDAEKFRSLQRKLSTTANTIEREALSFQFKPFLSDQEIASLQEAIKVLRGCKNKVEHAKEVKARKEKEDRAFRRAAAESGLKIWNELFQRPETRVETFLMSVAISGTVGRFRSDFFNQELRELNHSGIDYELNEMWGNAQSTFVENITYERGRIIMPDYNNAITIKQEIYNKLSETEMHYSKHVDALKKFEAALDADNVSIADFTLPRK